MELTIKERVLIPHLLPKEGKRIEMIVCKSIIEATQFTEQDVCDFGLVDTEEGGIKWDARKAKDKKVEFSPVQLDLLKSGAKRLDNEGSVTLDLLPLIDKILES